MRPHELRGRVTKLAREESIDGGAETQHPPALKASATPGNPRRDKEGSGDTTGTKSWTSSSRG